MNINISVSSSNNSLPYPELVLWDWDGTLADTLPFLRKANEHVKKELGLGTLSDDDFAQILAYSTKESYARAYGQRADEAVQILYDYVTSRNVLESKPMPGAEDVLKTLQSHSIDIGVVSNKRHDVLEMQIQHFNWQDYFSIYIGAGKAQKDKPAPDPIFLAIETLEKNHNKKYNIENIWYVGDSETDLKAAKAAGCPAVFFHEAPQSCSYLEHYSPGSIIMEYQTLIEFLEGNTLR